MGAVHVTSSYDTTGEWLPLNNGPLQTETCELTIIISNDASSAAAGDGRLWAMHGNTITAKYYATNNPNLTWYNANNPDLTFVASSSFTISTTDRKSVV